MAEAVGIVLALVPLVVSCCKDYGKVARLVGGFKKYTKSVRTHVSVLHIQQTIYLNANERLLGQCLNDVDQARRMLADPDDSDWRDPEVCSLYVERLADARQAFEDSIALISDELANIHNTLEPFEGAGSEPRHADPSLRKKVKYVFKHSSIDTSLEQLRNKTGDFRSLIDLTTTPQPTSVQYKPNILYRKQISRFSDVQDTALDLYQALGHACTKHTEHQAHLSLHPVSVNPTQVRFTIAFSQLSLSHRHDEQPPCSQPTWLTIESRLTGRLQSTAVCDPIAHPNQALKRVIDETVSTPSKYGKKLVKKRVQFVDACAESPLVKITRQVQLPPLTNLCTHHNFCNYLQGFIADTRTDSAAIGYLELPGRSKHLIYIDSKSQNIRQTRSTTNKLRSLYNMLRTGKSETEHSSPFSMTQKVQLAHQLATAMLQLHGTPWLSRSWNSREVTVAPDPDHMNGDGENNAIPKTYVTAQIASPHEAIIRVSTIPSPTVVRNAVLFRLGVMMLEIAFAHPLSDMTIDHDRLSSNSAITEFFTADRLGREVARLMGPKYAEITRKCIHCNFGCDFDLKLPKLREGFYHGVIRELEILEDRMKELW